MTIVFNLNATSSWVAIRQNIDAILVSFIVVKNAENTSKPNLLTNPAHG